LTLHDARKQLPHLHGLTKKHYPSLKQRDLVVKTNYAVYPPTFDVVALMGYTTGLTGGTSNDALVEKLQENKEKYALIESRVLCGQSRACVLAVATGMFRYLYDKFSRSGVTEDELDADNNDDIDK
jgi:hypothetical protein